MIPSREDALDIMDSRHVPRHILMHSLKVRQVAVAIASMLIGTGYPIDIRLVDRAAILHDVCKMDSIISGGDHASMGQELMQKLGYPLVGDVIGQHVLLREMVLDEAMVVNYADKRVRQDVVVSLDQRFVDLMYRYAKGEEAVIRRILKYHEMARQEEAMIVDACGMDPGWLNRLNLIPGDYILNGSFELPGKDALIKSK